MLLAQEFGQLEVEGSFDTLDGFLVLRPLAAPLHVADN